MNEFSHNYVIKINQRPMELWENSIETKMVYKQELGRVGKYFFMDFSCFHTLCPNKTLSTCVEDYLFKIGCIENWPRK